MSVIITLCASIKSISGPASEKAVANQGEQATNEEYLIVYTQLKNIAISMVLLNGSVIIIWLISKSSDIVINHETVIIQKFGNVYKYCR